VIRNLRIAIGLALLGAVGLTSAMATFSGDPPIETFDGGTPAAPLSFSDADWDVQVHSRDTDTWTNLEPIHAQHGPDCSAPPATHVNTSYEGSVFVCGSGDNRHIMTALKADGYGLIYLTPNRIVDFSNGATVQFDMSTLHTSTRDWIDIWVTPYEDALVLPFDQSDVDLQGRPRKALHLFMTTYNGQTAFVCQRIDNFVTVEEKGRQWNSLESALAAVGRAPSATVRDTFRFTFSPTSMTFNSPTIAGFEPCSHSFANAGFTSGVVQIGHHSYNPEKAGTGNPGEGGAPRPNTWHWDNISVSNSTPFTILQGDRRYIDDSGTVNFPPAPAGATLRFSAVGSVTVNGAAVAKQPSQLTQPMHFASYSVAIPEGATSAAITANFAKGFHIWARAGTSSPATATPTRTATATLTNTATPTPTATPTNTPTPIPPTATPTPAPVNARCTVRDRNDANTGWLEREGFWVEIAPNAWTCAVTSVGRVP